MIYCNNPLQNTYIISTIIITYTSFILGFMIFFQNTQKYCIIRIRIDQVGMYNSILKTHVITI